MKKKNENKTLLDNTVTAMTAGQALCRGIAAKLTAGALALCMFGGIFTGCQPMQNRDHEPSNAQSAVTETGSARANQGSSLANPEPSQTEQTTEQTTEPGETNSRLDFDTADAAYDYVLNQYRQALADPNFTAAAYPLVNADTVSGVAKRWSRYADENDLYAIKQDIDGNGVQELIILWTSPDAYYEGGKFSVAIHTWDGSLPVELLGEIGFERDDLLTVYDNGLIRCVKNGYLTSPALVTEYRLDAERAALQEQRQWTYTCTEQGEHSYRSADGTLLTPEEFYADCGNPVDLSYLTYWDEETRETKERGTLVASNPGTAEAAPVKDREDVPGEHDFYRLPQITLEGEAFENFNREIQQEFLEEGGKYFEDNAVVYDWSLNDDVLCVYISEAHGGYFPIEYRYFSISEGRELTEDKLLQRRGVDRAKLEAGLTDAIFGAFFRLFDHECYMPSGYASGDDFEDEISRLLAATPQHKESASYVLDRDGRLACIVRVSSMAGGDSYYHMLPVLWLD